LPELAGVSQHLRGLRAELRRIAVGFREQTGAVGELPRIAVGFRQ
jgi:hypothetical protein